MYSMLCAMAYVGVGRMGFNAATSENRHYHLRHGMNKGKDGMAPLCTTANYCSASAQKRGTTAHFQHGFYKAREDMLKSWTRNFIQ